MKARLAAVLGGLLALGAIASCGARTGFGDEDGAAGGTGEAVDAGDAGLLVPVDAPSDAHGDVLPKSDAAPNKVDCTDPTVTYVYVVTVSGQLLAFDPGPRTFTPIGFLACPAPPGFHPFSMAVNRKGTAFVLYDDGELFKVSTKTAACSPTPYQVGQHGFVQFGMGFATITNGPAEQLFVADTPQDATLPGPSRLGVIDTTTFKLKPVADFVPPQFGAELTGTGDGRLFAFTADTDPAANASRITQIDKVSGKLVASVQIPGVPRGGGWAFGFWGGAFWLFTTPLGGPRVTRYDPVNGEITPIGGLPDEVVGAGVSTCAPEE